MERPIGEMYHHEDDIVAQLKETGVLRRARDKYREQGTRLVNNIKATGRLIPELIPAWRSKGVSVEVSSTWQDDAYANHARTRVSLEGRRRGLGCAVT